MGAWTMGLESWLWMGAWALVLIVTVWLLVREPRPHPSDDPRAILRSRLARGEISRDEFEAAVRLLETDEGPGRVRTGEAGEVRR